MVVSSSLSQSLSEPLSTPLSWAALEALTEGFQTDRINGPTNAQATLRLFGQSESAVRVTLYRDNHAWCPYCQKIWLWLEEKRIPYRIQKVTMFCYGEKESWYKRKVPSGMLPALELDGKMITESDDILIALEQVFGPLNLGMNDPAVLTMRRLERLLFRAWCGWLCQPARSPRDETRNRESFVKVVAQVEAAIGQTSGPYFLSEFGTADVIFTPYVERMNASLFYYKGYSLRANPGFSAWFDAMESRLTYRGTQSDFHTHAHDLPPQMGGCWENGEAQTIANQKLVDQGPSWQNLPDVTYPEPETSRQEALHRVIKHRSNIVRVNPVADEMFDEALRCALTHLMTGSICQPSPASGVEVGLRYLRDRINVPRDMSIHAAKRLRESLEQTAALLSDRQPEAIPTRHRRDQNPIEFQSVETR